MRIPSIESLCCCIVQIGIFPGDMAKICPHTSTGRADYFGPAVNRAARLLCAAKAGQILVSSIFLFTGLCSAVQKHGAGKLYSRPACCI